MTGALAIDEILAKLSGVKPSGDGWVARCPVPEHDDHRQSLSVAVGDKAFLLSCHKGCAPERIVSAVGLTMSDLFLDGGSNGNGQRTIVATYDYVDEARQLLSQKVRFAPKDFRQRRPDRAGGWTWKLGNVRRVLYRLPEVVAGVAADRPVYVVEGEKDADALAALGLIATCNPEGASESGKRSKWRPEYSEFLRGAHVVIVADKDETGRAHAHAVAASLDGVAALVCIVEAAKGKDASDHLDAGYTYAEFVPIAEPGTASPSEPRIRVYVAPEIATLQPEQVDWVHEPFLAVGDVGSLEAPSKAGKSTYSRLMCASVAGRHPFLGGAVKHGPVLYCTEERAGTFREGLARASALELPDLHVMFLHDAYRMEWAEIVDEIGEHCQRLGILLAVIDTLSKWAGLRGDEEQSSGCAMSVMSPLQHLAAKGVAVLAIRHERKSGGAVGEAGRGSGAFTGDFDVIMSLRKVAGEKTQRRLETIGRHDEAPDALVIDLTDGEYRVLGDPRVLRQQEQERTIVELLPVSRNKQATYEDLAEGAKVSRQTVMNLMRRLQNDGVVNRAHGEVPDHPRADGFWLRGDDE